MVFSIPTPVLAVGGIWKVAGILYCQRIFNGDYPHMASFKTTDAYKVHRSVSGHWCHRRLLTLSKEIFSVLQLSGAFFRVTLLSTSSSLLGFRLSLVLFVSNEFEPLDRVFITITLVARVSELQVIVFHLELSSFCHKSVSLQARSCFPA